MNYQEQYRMLVESIRFVSAEFADQIAAVPDYVDVPDEIASTFYDCLLLLPQLRREAFVSNSAATSILALDAWFSGMPSDGSVAGEKNLKEHEFWTKARVLGHACLDALGEEFKRPNLDFLGFSPGRDGEEM